MLQFAGEGKDEEGEALKHVSRKAKVKDMDVLRFGPQ